MGRETATLIAGLAAAAVLPLLALGLGFPLWLSAVIAAGVFAGAWYLLRSGGHAGLEDEDLLAARSETARGLIDDATTSLDRLKKVAPLIRDETMRGQVQSLAKTTDGVLADVRANTDHAMAVRRLHVLLTQCRQRRRGLADARAPRQSVACPRAADARHDAGP